MSDDQAKTFPSERYEVTGIVKWFSPARGYGFIAPDDGSPDVLCHSAVVIRSGRDELPLGATIGCDVIDGPKVTEIHLVDTTVPPRESRG